MDGGCGDVLNAGCSRTADDAFYPLDSIELIRVGRDV